MGLDPFIVAYFVLGLSVKKRHPSKTVLKYVKSRWSVYKQLYKSQGTCDIFAFFWGNLTFKNFFLVKCETATISEDWHQIKSSILTLGTLKFFWSQTFNLIMAETIEFFIIGIIEKNEMFINKCRKTFYWINLSRGWIHLLSVALTGPSANCLICSFTPFLLYTLCTFWINTFKMNVKLGFSFI